MNVAVKPSSYRCIGIWVFAVIALAICLRANRFGADVLPDSGDYITAGVRLARGEGYSTPNRTGPPAPLTWFPPLFSLAIAGIDKFHWPIYRAVGIFNAGCYAALVAMAGFWVWRASGSALWSLASAALVLTNHAVYLVHSIVLSEPLFLLWVAACLWFISAWRTEGKLRFAFLAGVAISLAMLTRYAGLSLVPAAVLIALLSPALRWKQRFFAILVMLAIGLMPSFLWTRFHTPPHQSSTGRTLQWHPITRDCIHDGIETLASYVLPDGHSLGLPVILLLILGLLILIGCLFFGFLVSRTRFTESDTILSRRKTAIFTGVIFTLVYIAFLVASISLFDANTPLDERLLSPLVVPMVVVCCLGLNAMTSAVKSPIFRTVVGVLFCTALAAHVLSIRDELRQRQSPEDLAWFPTLQSDTLDCLHDIPAAEAVWSDKPCAIYMAYRLRTDTLPDRPTDPTADPQSTADYSEAIQTLRDNLTDAGGGWVVLWHQLLDFGDGFLNEDDIRKNFVVSDQEKFDDGILLRIDDPQAMPATQPAIK